MKNKKIFIAGHRGMAGSATLNFLKEKKFSNIITATRSKLDLTNSLSVEKFIKREKPDVVINCAGRVGVLWQIINIQQNFYLKI